MMSMSFPAVFAAWVVISVLVTASAQDATATEAGLGRGCVYHDANGNGRRDAGESGIAGVLVSNGVEIARTDDDGAYAIPVSDDCIIFVIKPRGYRLPRDGDGIARAHHIHKPKGSPELAYPGVAPTGPLPERLDFGLRRQEESTRFNVVLFGDTQPNSQEQVDFLARDVIPEVIGVDAAFGITLGDVVGDRLELFPRVNEVIGRIGLPWYYVYGNHDMNFDAGEDDHADETFERVYGPTNYAFQYGAAHFVVLDDVVFRPSRTFRRGGYRGGFDAQALGFLSNYLDHVPQDELVVVCFHIHLDDRNIDREAFFKVLARHPRNLSVSAHTHIHRTLFFGEDDGYLGEDEHMHLNLVTTCGSWWGGDRDERGVPHTRMRDGAPNGWGLLSIDGNRFALRTKVAGAPWNYQMDIWLPSAVPAGKAAEQEVVVNVFNGSERSRTWMRIDGRGPWIPLRHDRRKDPNYVRLKESEKARRERVVRWALKAFDDATKGGVLAGDRELFEAELRKERAVASGEFEVAPAMSAFDRVVKGRALSALRESFENKMRRPRFLRGLPFSNLPGTRVSDHIWVGTLPEGIAPGAHRLTVRTIDAFGETHEAHAIFRIVESETR